MVAFDRASMEDPKSKRVESRKPQMTTTMAPPHGTIPPQKPTCLAHTQMNYTDVKKRKLSNTTMEKDSPSFKIRALLQQIRPHFIEVNNSTGLVSVLVLLI